jgi:type VI secretion system protein VasD
MDRESTTLGDESAGSEEVVVRPGESRKLTLSPKPGVRFLGAVVLFRDIDRAQWRAIAPIATTGLTRLTLAIDRNKAVLEPA